MLDACSESPRRILFVALSNIGDLVMTTPALIALHQQFPQALIDVVADKRSGELLAACPFVGEIIWKEKQTSAVQKWRFLKKIRRRKYFLAIDLRGPWLAWLSRSEHRGTKRARRDDMHAVEHHFTAISTFIQNPDIPWTNLWVSQSAADKAEKIYADAGVKTKRLLALAPGANWPGKIWPAQHYAELTNLLGTDFDAVCLLGAQEDESRCHDIASVSNLPCIDLSGKLSLAESAACLARARFFVGNDSGLGHLAAALNVPSLTVFGPGEPHRYRPWGARAEIILAPQEDLSRLQPAAVAARVSSLMASA